MRLNKSSVWCKLVFYRGITDHILYYLPDHITAVWFLLGLYVESPSFIRMLSVWPLVCLVMYFVLHPRQSASRSSNRVSCQHKHCNLPDIYIEAQLSNSSIVRTSTVQHILRDISPLYLSYSNTTLHSGQSTHTGVHPSPILAESIFTYCYIRARSTKHELKLARRRNDGPSTYNPNKTHNTIMWSGRYYNIIGSLPQLHIAVRISGRSIHTLIVARKRTAPFYGDVHTELPPVSFPLFYTLPLFFSEPVLSCKAAFPKLFSSGDHFY
jgi:hypothetical protein